jgi:L-ascorbate metabolism protein UlaG (beta-lactamase superfamily)
MLQNPVTGQLLHARPLSALMDQITPMPTPPRPAARDSLIARATFTYYNGKLSDHFDGDRFFNLYGKTIDRGLRDILRWRRSRTPTPWPAPTTTVTRDRPPASSETLRIALVGHASLLIQSAGQNILIDPLWSERASPFTALGPVRHQPPAIAFEDLPPIDTVLITHCHYDHMDIPTLVRLHKRDQPRIITSLGNDAVLRRADRSLAAEAYDWWDRVDLGAGLTLNLCPAIHWSSRILLDRRRALWSGFVLHAPEGPVYLAGDTAFGDGTLFREIRRRAGAPLVAILPIGAYAPRWFMQPQHMDPDDAVRALLECGATTGLGIHWGTFQLSDEGQDDPEQGLATAGARHGVAPGRFRAARPGDVWTPPAG